MNNSGILFLNIGTKCLVRLAVSIYSLRQHYGGPVCIINAAGHDGGIVERFAADNQLGVGVRQIEIKIFRKRTAYVAKPSVYRWTPFDRTLFVDADTVFMADPSPLLAMQTPLAVTQFSDWNCGGLIVRKRIEPFLHIGELAIGVPQLASRVIAESWPAINTGVFAFNRDWPGMKTWERLTQAARTRANFTDEIAANVLLPFFGNDVAIVDDSFNWSPLYGKSDDPVIVHMHGNKHVRPEAIPFWWPVFQQCIELDIAGIRSWMPAGDKRLAEFLKWQENHGRETQPASQ